MFAGKTRRQILMRGLRAPSHYGLAMGAAVTFGVTSCDAIRKISSSPPQRDISIENGAVNDTQRLMLLVIPAKAGIQAIGPNFWIPAGAGMTHSDSKHPWPRSPNSPLKKSTFCDFTRPARTVG